MGVPGTWNIMDLNLDINQLIIHSKKFQISAIPVNVPVNVYELDMTFIQDDWSIERLFFFLSCI